MLVKRVLVLLIAIGLVAFVAGCGGKEAMDEPTTGMEDTTPPPAPPEENPVTEVPEEPADVDTAPVLNDVFFAFDKYNLTTESKGILEENADELKQARTTAIVIEGHCDERGTNAYNLALGEKRAQAAKDYLVTLGINGSRISVVSYGEERPFATGHNEAAWAKNRRAHFKLK
jgi:peptidoglycan-associated lipoprotein